MNMSKQRYQKEVGLVHVMTKNGKSLEEIMAKSKLPEDEVKFWRNIAINRM